MIANQKQYAAALKKLAMLQDSFDESTEAHVPEIVKETTEAQRHSLIRNLLAEISDYDGRDRERQP